MRTGATWGQGTLVPEQAGADEPPQERGKGVWDKAGKPDVASMAGLECNPVGRGTF